MNRLSYLWMKLSAMAWLVFARRAKALEVFNAMLSRWPGDAYALGSRAHLLTELGRHAEAMADQQTLTCSHPDVGAHWFNLGYMLEDAGRYEEALTAFQRCTALSPQLDRAWYGQGLVLIRLQRYDEAVVALKRNTELQPMSPYGWYQLARVHLDRKEPDEARKIIRHLKGFEPKVAAQLERESALLSGSSST
jgi:tetratricopeptide (TPR) repeat protein